MARYTITFKDDNIPANYPGVTTITGLIDKSTVLMAWAVKMMMLWLHEHWIDYVTKEAKEGFFVEFEEKDDYFKMLEDGKQRYKEVSDETKIIGNCVHDLVNEHIKSKLNKTEFDIKKMINIVLEKRKLPEKNKETVESRFSKTVEWFNNNVVRFIETEQPVCSKKHGFCGTLDVLAELKSCDDKDNPIIGGVYILDIKSSKDFYDGQAKQAVGYKIGREEGGEFHLTFTDDNDKENIVVKELDIKLDPMKIDGIGILTTNFKDTGKVKFKDYTKIMKIKKKAFLKLLDFYYSDKKRRLKNNPFIKKYFK